MAAMNHSTTSQLLSEEDCRFETLRNWTGPDINRRDMAKSGLYYDEASGHIVCFSCRIQIENWNRKDIPDVKHAEHSPLCPFIREKVHGPAKFRPPTSSNRPNKPRHFGPDFARRLGHPIDKRVHFVHPNAGIQIECFYCGSYLKGMTWNQHADVTPRCKFAREFIEVYRSWPCLWNKNCNEYYDEYKRRKGYNDLLKKLHEMEPNATTETVTKNINKIYSRLIEIHSAQNTGDNYQPSIRHLDFLIPYLNYEQFKTFKNDFHQGEKRKAPVTENGIQTNTANDNDRSEKKKRLSPNTQNGETTKVQLEEDKSAEIKSMDPVDLFCGHVAQTLKNAETQQRIMGHQIINLILNEIMTGSLKPSSYADVTRMFLRNHQNISTKSPI